MTNEHWTVPKAAVELSTTVEYVRQLLTKGKLERYVKGSRVYIDPTTEKNQQYIAQRRETVAEQN